MEPVSKRWLDARVRTDLTELARLTADDAVWHSPVDGSVRGRSAVLDQVRAASADTDEFSTETLGCEVRGDLTVAHVRNRGRREGKQLDSHQWLVIRTSHDLVADIDIHVDDPTLVERFWE